MEKKLLKRGIAAVAACTGVLALASCTNYSGEGNEFVVKGQVVDAGKESLKTRVTSIQSANGEADGWFEIGNVHQFHDNCDCHGTWTGRKTYGTVYDYNGYEIEPSDVPEGACVELYGKIRDDSDGKYTSTRPVFDTAQLIPC